MVLFKFVLLSILNLSEQYLHSTMVLFKFVRIYKPFADDQFTFHYGPIQIQTNAYIHYHSEYLHSTMVLFKFNWPTSIVKIGSIYIPLWSYSNWRIRRCKKMNYYIYIPLWSYSNNYTQSKFKTNNWNLHSTMVLFKCYLWFSTC